MLHVYLAHMKHYNRSSFHDSTPTGQVRVVIRCETEDEMSFGRQLAQQKAAGYYVMKQNGLVALSDVYCEGLTGFDLPDTSSNLQHLLAVYGGQASSTIFLVNGEEL